MVSSFTRVMIICPGSFLTFQLDILMIDIENVRCFTTNRPDFSIFGAAATFDRLPATHREQILFLNPAASAYIYSFSTAAHLLTGGLWDPFEKGNFKEVDEFNQFYGNDESKRLLKKWLFNKGIAFGTTVFLLEESNNQVILTTWKIMVKYAADIFISNDVMLFDKTLNWCLLYFHHDRLFFGRGNVYDATADEMRVIALNERKKKFPQFNHPYL